ncbi:MAG: outer membrane protein transport protein [Ignavibacteriales bacterium]|nr:outer membrane protein transport protein [Ignavibacteriales bacterium]
MLKKIILILLIAISASNIFGGGFQLNEHGARAMGMAGAFAGLANDPSAIYFNPAGITQLRGINFSAGVTLIVPKASFRGPSPAIDESKVKERIFNPINFYATYQFSDKLYFGLGVNNQYGLGTEWEDNWVGRELAVKTELQSFYFTPVVAYKVLDNLSLSVGLVYAYGTVEISRYTDFAPLTGEAKVSLKGNGSAWGFSAGVLYQPMQTLSFGLSVRSQNKFTFDGDAVSTGPVAVQGMLPKGGISSTISTPLNVTFGVVVKPIDKLVVTADYQYVGWSSYDKLTVHFKDINMADLSSVRDYQNTYILRLGAEYQLFNSLSVRGGLLYDRNPVKDEMLDPTLPDSDRLGFNVGVGYKLSENISVDIAYLFLRFSERKITNSQISYTKGFAPFNGTYNSLANLFGLNISYKL